MEIVAQGIAFILAFIYLVLGGAAACNNSFPNPIHKWLSVLLFGATAVYILSTVRFY